MFLIYGKRTARIKNKVDYQHRCSRCNTFEHDVKIELDYYHLFFIPIFPIGSKKLNIRCKNCREPGEDLIYDYYTKTIKTPFYLYSFLLLIAVLIAMLFINNVNTQAEKKMFIDNPKVGDVYQIRKVRNDTTYFYYLKVSQINSDTIFAYHNYFEYYHYVSKLNLNDFFIRDQEFYFTKLDLKQKLEKEEILAVYRNYEDYEGFNRIK